MSNLTKLRWDALALWVLPPLVAGMLVILTACNFTFGGFKHQGSTPNAQSLPLPPGAQGTKIQPFKSPVGEPIIEGTAITFQTNESPNAVANFYNSTLLSDNWTHSVIQTPAGTTSYAWGDGCPWYTLDVKYRQG